MPPGGMPGGSMPGGGMPGGMPGGSMPGGGMPTGGMPGGKGIMWGCGAGYPPIIICGAYDPGAAGGCGGGHWFGGTAFGSIGATDRQIVSLGPSTVVRHVP